MASQRSSHVLKSPLQLFSGLRCQILYEEEKSVGRVREIDERCSDKHKLLFHISFLPECQYIRSVFLLGLLQ